MTGSHEGKLACSGCKYHFNPFAMFLKWRKYLRHGCLILEINHHLHRAWGYLHSVHAIKTGSWIGAINARKNRDTRTCKETVGLFIDQLASWQLIINYACRRFITILSGRGFNSHQLHSQMLYQLIEHFFCDNFVTIFLWKYFWSESVSKKLCQK